jgi:hypothetical protein
MQYITLLDYFLLPFYLVIIYAVAYRIRGKFYPWNHPWRPYFIPALTVKIIGAIGISMLYQYYYDGYGDTMEYFKHTQVINSAIKESVFKWLGLVLHIPNWYDGDYSQYLTELYWYDSPAEFTVERTAAFLGAFTFTTYLPTSVLFAAFSFTGVWALYRTFASQYPHLSKQLAVAILFIPSTFMWGSGIFKDTICMFAIGWLTYCTFRMLTIRQFKLSYVALWVLSFILIAKVKVYILMAFAPALSLWILFNYLHKIKLKSVRFLIKGSLGAIMVIGFILLSGRLSASLGKYSLENMASTVVTTRDWINVSSADQSITYDLGAFDPSVMGMLKKFPAAVNVSLFRPYLWETKKVIQFLSSFEAFAILILTLKVLFSLGPAKAWKAISEDPNVQFCLIFTLIFGFAVGMSSFNFGTLSRYRIPCLPFYGSALVIMYFKYNSPKRKFFFFW